MSLRTKLILLSLMPFLLVAVAISWIAIHQARTLGQNEGSAWLLAAVVSERSA